MSESELNVLSEPSSPQYPLRAVIDSGPVIALFNKRDHWHETVYDWLEDHPEVKLFSTWPVLTEACALLARRLTNDSALNVLRWVQRGGITLDSPAPGSLQDVLSACERYADLPFDLADASVAESANRLKILHVVSIDSDFHVYRDKSGKALTNLLLSK